jgi:hypothetical protein
MKVNPNTFRCGGINHSARRLAALSIRLLCVLPGAGGALAQSISGTPAAIFYRPGIQDRTNFGTQTAAVGDRRVLVGANAAGGGEAYLFDPNGEPVHTFTNPTPGDYDSFGGAVAGVGTDKVLIGAWGDDTAGFDSGAAYLFGLNGDLLQTFTDPHAGGEHSFGFSVAAVGTDKVVIGAHEDDAPGAQDAGSAYLFSTGGALLKTFPNPAPALNDNFGSAVAAVGTDRVLIAARFDGPGAVRTGMAFLFHIDGTLLKTFNSPILANGEDFGVAVAAAGPDRVLIGASQDNAGNPGSGRAYLFGTDGTLLGTFTNPTPARGDAFGFSVSAVGRDRVLIGALYDGEGAAAAGAVHLFTTGGTLLKTFAAPSPVAYGHFGYAVAAMGTDRMLIGSAGGAPGAPSAGVVYRFDLPTPPLDIVLAGASVTVSWPAGEVDYQLQQSLDFTPANAWSAVAGAPVTSGGRVSATVPISGDHRFFRLNAR